VTTLVFDQIISLIIVLSIAASLSGFIAGLLGVGGGIIMVPALYYAFGKLGYDESLIMHMAIGTSLAIIIPTSVVSALSHMKYKAVDFKLVKTFGLSVAFGILIGTFVATNSKTPQLLLMFSFFAFCVAVFFIFFRDKAGSKKRNVPNFFKNLYGTFMGFMSVPLGIGAGSLGVPFLKTIGYSINIAIGTSATIGIVNAVCGATSMAVSGLIFFNISAPYSLGFINIAGFLVFVPITMIFAPIGAKITHSIDKVLLSRIFGLFLMVISIRAFIEYLKF
jgi:uncharacterized membrane protein YfcA